MHAPTPAPTQPPSRGSAPAWLLRLLTCVALAGAILVAYAGVRHNGWVLVDDPVYVAENPQIQRGLTPANFAWSFTHVHGNNWHPVTTLSHMLDAQLFGTDPVPQHVENVLWHVVNALLVLWLLHRLTRCWWRAAAVAALFALHPLRVESVAWASERKDLLSACFFLLMLAAYQRWTERPSVARHAAVAAALALGLLSKPMLVTAPFVLLLLDVWPLGRLRAEFVSLRDGSLARRVGEKWLLFALVAASIVATYVVQKQTGAVSTTDAIPLGLRLANALVSLCTYAGRSLWPGELAAFYPFPKHIALSVTLAALLALVAAKLCVWLQRDRRPWLLVGFLWFAGMLVPVIGLVQVGRQGWADRYSYLPTIGLAIVLVWTVAEWAQRSRTGRALAAAALLVACALLGVATAQQVPRWRDSETLYRRALHVTPVNAMAHLGLGNALMRQHRGEQAVAEFTAALGLEPNDEVACERLAVALGELGRHEEARTYYLRMLRIRETALGWVFLGDADMQSGHTEEAVRAYERALRLDSRQGMTHVRIGIALVKLARGGEAIEHFARATALQPEQVDWHVRLAGALLDADREGEALAEYAAVLRLQPNHHEALLQCAWLKAVATDAALRDGEGAVQLAERARAQEPTPSSLTEATLAAAYAAAGRKADALAACRRAIALAERRGTTREAAVYRRQLRAYEAGQ